MSLTITWILWVSITAISAYYCARVANHAAKDFEWVKQSCRNGQLLVDAAHQKRQAVTLFIKQLVAFFIGLVYPLIESRSARGWVVLSLVVFWTVTSMCIAYWSLQNRRRQWQETAARIDGYIRTRREDGA